MRRTGDEPLFNSLMEQHHYLKYEQPVGEHLKYLAWAQGRPIACLAWSSAPRHLGSRDRYIGWSAEARRRNIRFIAYNTRFLILPWVRVPHLASHILGRMAAVLSDDWYRMYGHPIYFAETFIDPGAFSRDLLPCGQLATAGAHNRARQERSDQQAEPPDQGNPRLASDAALPRVPQPDMTMQTADRREPGRTGPDHRSRPARAAERIRRPEAQNRDPRHGGAIVAETDHGEDQSRSAAGYGADKAGRPANRLRPVMGATAPLRLRGAQQGRRSRTPHSIPATFVQSAAGEKCTARKSRQRW